MNFKVKVFPVILITLISVVMFTTACNSLAESAKGEVNETVESDNIEATITNNPTEIEEEISYQSILDEYTIKLQEATPTLIEEYEKEALENQDGLMGLANISSDKTLELANISSDGTLKMANYFYEHGSGKYSEYEDWASKLNEVYMEEAAKINEAYMKSAK